MDEGHGGEKLPDLALGQGRGGKGRRVGASGPHLSNDVGLFEMKEKFSVALGARAEQT